MVDGDAQPHDRLPDPFRHRLHVAGERRLLLARGRRQPRARAHPARLPARRGDVRADRADLRRGLLAAPGARRLHRVRPLRLQRARLVRRRVGDPPRLHHPDRGLRLLRDAVPQGLLGAAGQPQRGVRARPGDHRLRRALQHPRPLLPPRAAHRRARRRGARPRAVRDRARPRPLLQPPHRHRVDPPGERSHLVRPDLRAHHHHDGVHLASSTPPGSPGRCGPAAARCAGCWRVAS